MNQKLLDYIGKIFEFESMNPQQGWIESSRWNGTSFLHGILTNFTETGEEQLYTYDEPTQGGIIIFSTDVNAVIDEMFPDASKLKKKVLSIWETLKNRVMVDKKLTKAILPHKEVYGFSIGNFFKGRYRSDEGGTFDEKSKSIEIVGVPFELICAIGAKVAVEFKQQSVLVKDNSSHVIRFIRPITSQGKI